MNLNAFSNASRSLSGSIIVIAGSTRDDIESVQSCWLWLLLACTLVVAVGVVIEEAVEHLSDERTQWVVEPQWHHSLIRIGWTLVIMGDLGEGLFEAAISFADRTLQEFNNTLLAITTDQAHNAAASAKTAHEEADAVKKEAKEIEARLKIASRQLATLQEQSNAITPRSWILRNAERTIAKALSPFPKQYFGVEICGSRPMMDENLPINTVEWEKSDTKDAIFDAMMAGNWASLGFRWPLYWSKCPSFWKGKPSWRGIFVFVDKDAPPKILEAANALSGALTSVLPPQPTAALVLCDLHSWHNPADQSSPCMQITNRPYAIGVLIGTMPLASEAGKKQNSKTNTNPPN